MKISSEKRKKKTYFGSASFSNLFMDLFVNRTYLRSVKVYGVINMILYHVLLKQVEKDA